MAIACYWSAKFGAVPMAALPCRGQPSAWWWAAVAVAGILGAFGATLLFTVPFNEALAGAAPPSWPAHDAAWTA